MDKEQWVTWISFLQSSECIPENEDELEVASSEMMEVTNVQWTLQDKN